MSLTIGIPHLTAVNCEDLLAAGSGKGAEAVGWMGGAGGGEWRQREEAAGEERGMDGATWRERMVREVDSAGEWGENSGDREVGRGGQGVRGSGKSERGKSGSA